MLVSKARFVVTDEEGILEAEVAASVKGLRNSVCGSVVTTALTDL